MKSIPICVIFVITAIFPLFVLSQVDNGDAIGPPPVVAEHDGQPGCHLRYEFSRLWRNNFAPEQYWECTEWQRPAVRRHCPVDTQFQDSWQACVPFNQWQWTPYSDPPTTPDQTKIEECDELILDIDDECKVTEIPTETTTPNPPNPCPCDPPTTTTQAPTTEDPCSCLDPIPRPIIQCPGASDAQHSPGTWDCNHVPHPSTCTIQTNYRRLATNDPRFYYQCNFLAGWQILNCPVNSCFDGHIGVCTVARFWSNICRA